MLKIIDKPQIVKLSNANDRIIKLQDYQDKFIFSKSRYPAMIAAWGTGKTMCAIEKAKIACENFPDNLGVIFRKEFTDLRDSTIKDFESYTGVKVDSSREAVIGKSKIMFRHLEEMNNIQNINLGFFIIEQAEELETDDIFFKLHGRLRRANVNHFGAIIANTKGHNWIYKLWKAKQMEDYELIEAKTFDNEKNLPVKFIYDLRKLKELKPKIYNRFVENSWEEDDTEARIISAVKIKEARERILDLRYVPIKRIIGVDVARSGKDKTIAYAMENGKILDKLELEKTDLMSVVGSLLLFAEKNKHINNFAVDEIGVGAGVVDRLKELGKKVVPVNSASKAHNPKFKNIRAEVYGYGAENFENGTISLNGVNDEDLFEQLTWSQWKNIDSTGVLQVEAKEDIVDRYGRSPDNADAYLYGLWGLQFVQQVYTDSVNNNLGWRNGNFIPNRNYQVNLK